MALREDQIVRYGRQILLRDLGGRGQERLLGAPVRVIGSGAAIDDAVAWLQAGGTPVTRVGPSPGGFLHGVDLELPSTSEPVAELLSADQASQAKTQVVVGAGVAYRGPSACEECWGQLLKTLSADAGGPIGSLAALTLQRLVLGWSDDLGIVHWRGNRFESGSVLPCSHDLKVQ